MTYIQQGLLVSGAISATLLCGPMVSAQSAHGYTPDLLPQGAQSGQCYARVKHGATYAPNSEIVEVESAYQTVAIKQPVLQRTQKSIKVKDESVRYVVRQPQYRTVQEQVMISPDYQRLSVTAPQFSTIVETL